MSDDVGERFLAALVADLAVGKDVRQPDPTMRAHLLEGKIAALQQRDDVRALDVEELGRLGGRELAWREGR